MDIAITDRIQRGETPEEAEMAVLREFGNRLLVSESVRHQWGWSRVESFGQDLRYGIRILRAAPGFTALAVLALSLGIGASTVMFGVLDGVLLNPFPYPHGDRLVMLSVFDLDQSEDTGRRWTLSAEEERAFEQGANLFEGFVTCETGNALLDEGETPRWLKQAIVSPNTFEFIGIPAKLGRVIQARDGTPGVTPVAVLSEPAWRKYFGADPGVVGRTVTLDHQRRTIIGVAPKRYAWWTAEVWVPQQGSVAGETEFAVQGRLKPGVSMAQANEQLTAIGARLKETYPERYPKHFQVRGVYCIDDIVHAPFRRLLYTLLGAVGLLLLIACSNVANMLLSRATVRQREISVRMAIGAGRLRILRQLLMESALLALLSTAGGVALAFGGIQLLKMIVPPHMIAEESVVDLNPSVLLFALGVSVLTVALFGLTPAWQLTRRDWGEALHGGARGSAAGDKGAWVRDLLVMTQVGMALVLLVGASLLARSFIRSLSIDLRVNPRSVAMAFPAFPPNSYATLSRRESAISDYVSRLRALPGVIAATQTSEVPASFSWNAIVPLEVPDTQGRRHSKFQAMLETADWGARDTFGYRLLAGRWFSKEEVAVRRPVGVINDSLARAMGGPAEVIGRQIRLPHGMVKDADGHGLDGVEVIGVTADTPNRGLRQLPLPMLEVPSTVAPRNGEWVALRAAGDANTLLPAMEREMAKAAPGVSFYWINSLDTFLEEDLAPQRFALLLLGIFAAIGTTLLVIGLYGVMSYAVARRTYELGLRIALGASRADVIRLITIRGITVLAAGVFAGVLATVALARLLQTQLGDTSPYDPAAYLAAGALLVTTALAAILIPGMRALRISPARTLRHE